MLKARVSVFNNEERYYYERTKEDRMPLPWAEKLAIFICH